jgi:hypothetical protein
VVAGKFGYFYATFGRSGAERTDLMRVDWRGVLTVNVRGNSYLMD